jgi:bifunctional non-homologous end joining protein LigD
MWDFASSFKHGRSWRTNSGHATFPSEGRSAAHYNAMRMAELAEYRRKRRFAETAEPRGPEPQAKKARKDEKIFVIQKHAARRLHYDLRLEVGGVLKSWAVPKGPSLNPGDKRLAVQVEDHPFEYRKFEGTIPEGNYGAGEVIIWDQGTYEPEGPLSAAEQLERGELKFRLHGHKLNGSFVLVKLKHSRGKNEWLLIKHRDDSADPMWNVEEHGESVVSGRPLPKTQKEKRSAQDSAPPNPADLPGARSAPMPRDVSVTLAKLADKAFSDPNWLFEIKWDGIRTVAYVENGIVNLFARSKREVTAEFPEFQDLARYLRAGSAILDGEIVTLDENGRSDFQKLQNRFGVSKPSQKLITEVPLTYYLFDVLYCNGFDVRKTPLAQRKELLRQILRGNDRVRYSEHQLEKGKELYAVAKEQGLEGIVGKQIESPYTGNRTGYWLKFKIVNELDAVIVGWTAPRRTRQYFGALVLALYDEKKELQFIGSAGTGFDQKTQKDLLAQLEKLRIARSPLSNPPKLREHVEWVRPAMVARIKFANWTEDNHLRAPVFLGIGKDRTPDECTFDAARPERAEKRQTVGVASNPARSKAQVHDTGFEELAHGTAESLRLQIEGRTLALTHLNKIYFPESGIRKRDLIAYYHRMADHILPFLKDRPLVMRRYPNGIQEQSFFQKEAPESIPDWIKRATVYSDERAGEMDYVMAQDRPSLLFLTNLGCIDHNPWSSRFDNQDYPDYVFFDLDPTPETPFTTVLRVARSIYKVLVSTRLTCFLKTSGATGFHIYVPLEPIYKYAETRTFAAIISQIVASELPRDTTLERSVRKRPPGRVLLDALQNAKGKPLAAVYSARAHPGATVSTPVTAEELMNGNIDPDAWTIKTLFARLQTAGDLWKDFWNKRQTLDAALEALTHRLSREKQSRKADS